MVLVAVQLVRRATTQTGILVPHRPLAPGMT